MTHHVRFSLEFLLRNGLLDDTAHLRGLAGVVAHLYYTEPGRPSRVTHQSERPGQLILADDDRHAANFALLNLLKSGVFHAIVTNGASRQSQLRQILIIIAHLFNR